MTNSLLTFALAGTAYAIPLGRVREVVTCRTIVRVPNANACVLGVMNLRGSVVPVIDFARLLGADDTGVDAMTCAVLVETEMEGEATTIAALVDEIRAVIELEPGDVAEPPEFGTPVDPRLVLGVTRDEFAWVLDLDEVLNGIA